MSQYPRRQNVSTPRDQNMSQRAKCFNTPILHTTTSQSSYSGQKSEVCTLNFCLGCSRYLNLINFTLKYKVPVLKFFYLSQFPE